MSLSCSLARACVLVSLSALFLPAPVALAACQPARTPPSVEYLGLVTRYSGDGPAEALTALGAWNPDTLRCDLDNLYAAAVAVSRCRDKCEDRVVFDRFSVRSALLLHAAREIADQYGAPVSEQSVSCSTGPQAQTVERLASILVLVDPDANAFLGRFYVAMTRRAQWSHCLPQAEQWARTGLKRLPRNGALLMTLGIVVETTAFLTLVPAPRSAILSSQAGRQFDAQTTRIGALWERARSTFEEALSADSNLHEARLRMGRVLWRLNRLDAARACFDAVLAKSDDQVIVYLAHLFLGQVHQDQDHAADAEREYLAALEAQPHSEAAAVALSHTRLSLGELAGAREAMSQGLEQVRRRVLLDPYKNYPMTHTREGQIALDEMRKALVR